MLLAPSANSTAHKAPPARTKEAIPSPGWLSANTPIREVTIAITTSP